MDPPARRGRRPVTLMLLQIIDLNSDQALDLYAMSSSFGALAHLAFEKRFRLLQVTNSSSSPWSSSFPWLVCKVSGSLNILKNLKTRQGLPYGDWR